MHTLRSNTTGEGATANITSDGLRKEIEVHT